MGDVLSAETCTAPCTEIKNDRPLQFTSTQSNSIIQEEQQNEVSSVSLQAPAAFDALVIFTLKNDTTLCDKTSSIDDCQYTQRLINVLNRYNNILLSSKNDKKADKQRILFLNQCVHHIGDILDDFIHILLNHNLENDDNYQFIYNALNYCDLKKCISASRHYRNKHQFKGKYFHLIKLYFNDSSYDTVKNDGLIYLYQIMDKIHCNLQHCYDIGYKLTVDEQNMINNKADLLSSNDSDIDVQLIELRNLLSTKRSEFNKICDIKYEDDDQKTKYTQTTKRYSYSYPFFYWDYYRHISKDFIHGHSFSNLYVPKKYVSFKDEMVDNALYSIDIEQWNIEMKKCLELHSTKHCRERVKPFVARYMPQLINEPEHVSNYGYNDYSNITVNHLISLAIYCNFSRIKETFLKTFHPQNDDEKDGFLDIKKRHSNYHYLAKYLRESVNIFGTLSMTGNIQRFYHNIGNKVVFDSTQANIYSVMSTTSSWNVAVNQSIKADDGIIVEMVPVPNLKYFNCNWLSSYSNENEIIFIGGTHPIDFTNIILMKNGYKFGKYIKALRIIDTLTNGYFLDNDCTIYFKMVQLNTADINKLGAEKLSESMIELVINLINHELNRSDNNRYKKYNNLHPYIDELLHHICINKQKVTIDLETMNTEIKEIYQSGYIGYLFLKNMICNHGNENYGINYQLINMLFPNLQRIYVNNFKMVNDIILDNLIQFLSVYNNNNNNDKLKRLQLSLSNKTQSNQYSAMIEQALKRENKFKELQFKVSITQNRSGNKALSINKIESNQIEST